MEVLYRAFGATSLSTTGILALDVNAWTSMYLMGSSAAGEELSNGSAHTFKLWHAALSDVEILAESFQEAVVRTANIDSYMTLPRPTYDVSGNNRDWTPSGTFATEANSTFPGFRLRSRGQDGAVGDALPRRLRPLAALGVAPPVADQPPGRRALTVRDATTEGRDAQPGRKVLSFAALAQGATVAIPGPRRRCRRPRCAALLSEQPLRRVLSLAAAAYIPPVPGSPVTRRRLDVRRNRARVR
jgi:hypothetical protein